MRVTSFWNTMLRSPADAGVTEGGSPPEEAAEAASEAQEAEAPSYDWAPEEYRKDGAFDAEGFKAHYQDLLAEKARREDGVPEAYAFTPPDGFDPGVELPEGVKVELDPDNPLYGDLGALLKEHGAPQGLASGLSGLLLKYEAQRTAQLHAEATREYEALGKTEAAREARIAYVGRALETKLPADEADALKGMAVSAAAVRALEKLLKPASVAAPSATPNTPDLDSLSAYEKIQLGNRQSMKEGA